MRWRRRRLRKQRAARKARFRAFMAKPVGKVIVGACVVAMGAFAFLKALEPLAPKAAP